MFKDIIDEWTRKERGSLPTPIECTIIIWVFAIMWKEIKVRRIPIDFVILFSFSSVARKTISFIVRIIVLAILSKLDFENECLDLLNQCSVLIDFSISKFWQH